MTKKTIICVVICFVTCIFNYSQTPKNCGEDGPQGDCSQSAKPGKTINQGLPNNLGGSALNTSPNPVPQGTDRSFVKNEQANVLDTYTCRAGSPLVITIPISRVITKIDRQSNPTGYNDVINWHTQGGTLSVLKIKLPVYDIDPTEVDKVYFNDEFIGNLYGKNNAWELNEFTVPISKVNFGKYQGIDNAPLDGSNVIKIEIDTQNDGWCASIDWISLSFETLSPIALIHGNGSSGAFFPRRLFTQTLTNQRILFDHQLNMPVPGNYIEQEAGAIDGIPNNKRVQTYLRKVARAFGVDSMHVVMHSKGGLDTRSYLANLYPQDKNSFKILSYTSLGTPHNGTILADMGQHYSEGVKKAGRAEFSGLPGFINILALISGFTKGHENLTTGFVNGFNQTNIGRLRETGSEIDFHTIAGDADININGGVDYPLDVYCEQEGLAEEQISEYLPQCFSLPGPDTLYQILKKNKEIQLSYTTRPVVIDGIEIQVQVAVVSGVPTSTYQLNDTLVTVPSGHGANSIFPLVAESHRKTYRVNEGKNHASIANEKVAVQVLTWVIGTESRKGDLKTLP